MKKLLIPALGGSLLLATPAAQAALPMINPCNVLSAPMVPGVNIADAVGTCNDNTAVVEVLINDTAYYYENFEQATSTHGILTVTSPLNPTGAIDGWYNESDSNPVEGALAVSYTAPGHNHAYAKSLFGGVYPYNYYNPDTGNYEYRSLSFAASARSLWVDILTFDADGSYSATFAVDGLAGGLTGSFTTWSWPSPYDSLRSWQFDVTVLGLDDPVYATLSMGQSSASLTSSFNESGTLRFDYLAGNRYLIVASLDVGVSNGGTVDFYNTATLSSLTLTPGTTMSAMSGADYFNLGNTAAPPIPEPETYALMLAGLGLVGFAARRQLR
ncbi:MAG: PEP-CTERM sorting domain-containing protein [Thiobacillus sp.]|nr:PEP-CTERM sorting domain-containing protein [Thiobacillus sp.]